MKPLEWMIHTEILYDKANKVTIRGVDNFIITMEHHIDWWRKEKVKEYGHKHNDGTQAG